MSRLPASVQAVAWQEIEDLEKFGLDRTDVEREVWWVADGRTPIGGSQAVCAVLARIGGPWSVVGALLNSRGVSPLAAWAYRWVANHRPLVSRFVRPVRR